MRSAVLIAAGCTVFAATTLAGVYKWTDNDGNVHYTDTPPSGIPAQPLIPDPAPPLEATEKARARLEAMTETVQMHEQKQARATEITRLSSSKLTSLLRCLRSDHSIVESESLLS